MKASLSIIIPVFCLLAACTKEPLTTVSKPNTTSALGPDSIFSYTNTINKDVLLALVNDARNKGCNCGDNVMPAVAPVKWSQRLEKAAWLHSKEMSDSNYLSHTGKNGSTAGDRIKRMGYNWKTYCENIALGYLSEKETVDGWLKSPTHCRALMNASVTETGIGRYGTIWTQELATR
ncbi:CAP domain-containing protein [Chitinophaga sedimenti]|uniref:CAP domain-containing protein n=1 Tax=Chitinophaga sedimenti TaxID=2033606 RepID=UPI0020031633|nr:CAP domain-containing protein [Chitinophaga sedimenti]MCK7555460.1 CAP domain-containing protein [Chitinophaga sedimenti]